MSTLNVYTKEREELATKTRNILETGKKSDGFTQGQIDQLKVNAERLKDLDKKIAGIMETQNLLDSIQTGPAEVKTGDYAYLDRSPKALRTKGAEVRELIRTKALIGTGTHTIPSLLTPKPVMMSGQTAYTLHQLLQQKVIDTPSYKYLRQTVRDHKAAVVPVGAQKPTSEYTFEEVTGDLAIIAHLSEPFHEYWAKDFPEAVEALTAELINGIFDKQEDLIINGTGTGGNPTGILNTAGTQTQAYDTDQLTTTRTGITKLETLGYSAGAFLLHPLDWQEIELTRNTAGQLEFNSGPIDRSAMKLWGVPVATSPKIAQGQGLVFDLDSAHILTDGNLNLQGTSTHGDDFEHNQMRIRAEGRFDIAVTKPQAIVKLALTE